MEPRTIFFIGKPGSGKGTQAKILAEKTGWEIIAAGEQFRALAAEDTALGRKVKSVIDSGVLTPSWFPMYLYLKALFSLPEDEGVIFDGFNRKVSEAELITESLKWFGRPFSVLYLRTGDDELRGRLTKRKEIEGRADDRAVDKRFEEYYANTEPTIELFQKEGVLIEINGEQTPEEVARDVEKALKLG